MTHRRKGICFESNSRLNFCLLSGFSVFFGPINKHEPPHTHLMCPRPVLTCNLRLCLICLHKHWPPPFPPSPLLLHFLPLFYFLWAERRKCGRCVFSPCFFHGREQRQRSAPDSRTKRTYGDKNQNKGDPCAAAEERRFGCS